jgi:clathrin heavy chain
LSIIEVGVPKEQAFKRIADIRYENPQDFAVSMLADNKHGILFLLTKAGYLNLFEIQSGKCIFSKRISQATMFASVHHVETGGVVTLDQTGRLVLIALDEGYLSILCSFLSYAICCVGKLFRMSPRC